jgi:hypothetical protein
MSTRSTIGIAFRRSCGAATRQRLIKHGCVLPGASHLETPWSFTLVALSRCQLKIGNMLLP